MRWEDLRRRVRGRMPMPITHVVPIVHHETDDVVRRAVVSSPASPCSGQGCSGRPCRPGPVKEFYGATLTVAGVWTAGGLLSGPLHLGWIQAQDERLHRPVLTPVATGVGAFGFFYACALVARSIRRWTGPSPGCWSSPRRARSRWCCSPRSPTGSARRSSSAVPSTPRSVPTTRCSPRPRSTRSPPRPPATPPSCWPPR